MQTGTMLTPVKFLRAMLAIRAEDAANAREDARADGNVEDPARQTKSSRLVTLHGVHCWVCQPAQRRFVRVPRRTRGTRPPTPSSTTKKAPTVERVGATARGSPQ